jgi:hypothetical protein
MRILPLIAAAALAACSPPASKAPDAPEAPPPAIAACNTLAPDFTKLVSVQDEAAAALPSADLRGGPLTPGTYDLVRAVRIGASTGWTGGRAAVLEIAEGDAGVVFNWAGGAQSEPLDTWTASFVDGPQARVTYTCGRIGAVNAAFVAQPDALDLRIDDGAAGALHMVFEKRG